jgi:hypothetical protein
MALQLHRTVGNVAFRALLQRAPTLGWDPTKPNKSFKRTHHTSPNRPVEKDGVKLRNVLINGLKHGLTQQDTSTDGGAAVEDTAGKAVVWMPEALKPKDPVQVLLHLHGFGSGYRELTRDKSDYAGVLKTGETRDEDLYHLPEQLAASMKTLGRQVVAVLPQGRGSGSGGMFGNLQSNPTAYLDEVFQTLKDQKVITDVPSSYSVVLTGHSGAGPELLSATRNLEKKPTSGTNFGGLSEVVMFDAINGINELKAVKSWLTDHIANDVLGLKGKTTHSDDDMKKFYSDKTRFRGYFTHGYKGLYDDLPTWIPNEVETRGKDLDGTALKWMEWQYRVIGPIGPKPTAADPYGPHEHLLATPNANKAGLLAEVLDTSTSPP